MRHAIAIALSLSTGCSAADFELGPERADPILEAADAVSDASSSVSPGVDAPVQGDGSDEGGGADACSSEDVDDDDDGFASVDACGADCNDRRAIVFPGNPQWFAAAIDGSWDYDCSGAAERRFVERASCQKLSSGCVLNEGWLFAPPPCGVASEWATGCTSSGSGSCALASERVLRTQECH